MKETIILFSDLIYFLMMYVPSKLLIQFEIMSINFMI